MEDRSIAEMAFFAAVSLIPAAPWLILALVNHYHRNASDCHSCLITALVFWGICFVFTVGLNDLLGVVVFTFLSIFLLLMMPKYTALRAKARYQRAHHGSHVSMCVPHVPVEVNPQDCSEEELTVHLEAFVQSFVIPIHQERWLTFLVEKRSKWYPVKKGKQSKYYGKALNEFEAFFPLERTPAVKFITGIHAYPMALKQCYGTALGVYFDLRSPACKVTAAEAATLVLGQAYGLGGSHTAILSFVPGKEAWFFDYEEDEGSHGIWVCRKA